MKYTESSQGDGEDDDSPPEYGSEQDDAGVLWCPHCGGEMHGDSTRCPTCGDYVTPRARPASAMPWWIWAGLIAIGLAMLLGTLAAY